MMKFVLFFLTILSSSMAFAQLVPVESKAYHWSDFPVKTSEGRESRKILEGTSPHLEYFEMHATTQYVGAKPSEAHANDDVEELIIVKEGLMKVTIEDRSDIIGAGSVIQLLPKQSHSMQNVGDTPLTYYVMKYRSKKPMNLERGMEQGGSLILNVNTLPLQSTSRGASRKYFDRPTAMCERFEMHVTQLHKVGPSHQPHSHDETEIILVLSGDTEMMIDGNHYQASAGDFYLIASNLFHGVSNASDKPCAYLAFKWK